MKAQAEIKDSVIVQLPLEMAIAELGLESVPVTKVSVASIAQAVATPLAETEIKREVVTASDLSLDGIKERWHEFLLTIKKINHSLSFVLKVCQPTAVTGKELQLSFRHKIHKDRISDIEIKRTVENALQEIYGHDLLIKAVLDETLVLPDAIDNLDKSASLSNNTANEALSAEDQEINKLLQNFGGKVDV